MVKKAKGVNMPAGMSSNPYNPAKEHVPRLTLCELCERIIPTPVWLAHKNSKQHQALEIAEKEKENAKSSNDASGGWGGEASGTVADVETGFKLAPSGSGNDGWVSSVDNGRASSGGSGATSGYSDKVAGGGGDRACFGCGEVGHTKRDCPKGGSGGGRACFGCGEVGHNKRDCPKGGSGSGGQACFNCGQEGYVLVCELLNHC